MSSLRQAAANGRFDFKATYPRQTVGHVLASREIDLDQFGALGSDPVVNAATLQAAATYAAQSVRTIVAGSVDLTTCAIKVPRGLWKYTGQLTLGEGVWLTGESPSTTALLPQHTGMGVALGDGTRFISNARIRNIAIIGNLSGTLTYQGWTTTTSVGVQLNQCVRSCGLENVMVIQCATNVMTVGSFQFHIRDSYISYALTHNLWMDNGTASEVSNCRFDWCEGSDNVYLDGSGAETIGFSFTGNAVQISWFNGIKLYDVTGAKIERNHFEGNYRTAVDGTTHVCADINIATGPNSRGRIFQVSKNFFTPGSSPAVIAYTAIRCDRFNAITIDGNIARDGHYWRAVDTLASGTNGQRLTGLGNDFSGPQQAYAYASPDTDILVQDLDGQGVNTISKARIGGLRTFVKITGSNFTSDARSVLILIDCTAGARSYSLRDIDAIAGTLYYVKKTDATANALTIIPESGSTKTVDGAASLVIAAARGHAVIASDGTNWMQVG